MAEMQEELRRKLREQTEQTDAAEVDYAAFWWAQQSGETETWEQLNTEEREAVMENCYAETVADWLAAREGAAEARGAQAVLAAVEAEAETTVPIDTTSAESYQAGFIAAWDAARAAAGGGAR